MDLYQDYSTTDFHRKAQAIASNIQKISTNVSSMQRLVNQLSGVSSSNDDIQNQLNQISHYTGQLAKDTSEDIKVLNKFQLMGEQRQLKVQREKLTSDFTTVLNSFQHIQTSAANREKIRLDQERKAALSQDEDMVNNDRYERDANNLVQYNRQKMQDQQHLEDNSQLLERERAIRQLESEILDVNQIFKDLATMVHDQGEMVDSIEANVESAQIQVTSGAEEISRALTYQNKARRKKCIIFLIVAVIFAIFISIIIAES